MTDDSRIAKSNVDSRVFNLYEKKEKIYTRKIEGVYQRLRLFTGWPFLIGYFIFPWLTWDGRQAILFDLGKRQFHIFGLTFWPQDFMLLSWALIISAFALFFFTTLAGRIYCGYTCPQTIWTAMFMWIEQKTEGSRNQRMRLDKAPWTVEKFIRKALKHGMWFGVAFATGFTFVGYFVPIKMLSFSVFDLSISLWSVFWMLFFTAATYINAGWLREHVCIYMCPYARFQSVMFDSDTLVVSYDETRGEKRGARKRGSDYHAKGLGDCIDCQVCVQVCPTGIDIRKGLQYQCINCALCIDGCNDIMDKMGYPRGLIRYSTENQIHGKGTRFFRPKLIGYGLAVLIMVSLFSVVLFNRVPAQLDVIRDRESLFKQPHAGLIENNYTLKIMNMDQRSHKFNVRVMHDSLSLTLVGQQSVLVDSGQIRQVPVRVIAQRDDLKKVNYTIWFEAESVDDATIKQTTESRFIGPVR